MPSLGTILFVWRDLTAHEGGARDQVVVRRVAGIQPGRDLETLQWGLEALRRAGCLRR